jgi:hypothetical protein
MGFIHLFNGLVLLNLLGQSSGSSGSHVFFTHDFKGFLYMFPSSNSARDASRLAACHGSCNAPAGDIWHQSLGFL